MGADKNDKTVMAFEKARITITLFTSSGPFRFRNVEFLIFKEGMDEVLLSRALLKSIGFDLEKHLFYVRAAFCDANFSHIGFSAGDENDLDGPLRAHPPLLTSMLIKANELSGKLVPLDEEPKDDEARRTGQLSIIADAEHYDEHQPPEDSDSLIHCTIDVGKNLPSELSVLSPALIEQALENGFPPDKTAECGQCRISTRPSPI